MSGRDLGFCAATFHGDQHPVHVGFVCGRRLRFYAAPTSDRRPWLSSEDLFDMLGTPVPSRPRLVRVFQEVMPEGIATIWADGSPVQIVETGLARGLVGFCDEAAGLEELADGYTAVCGQAFAVMWN
ncbi:hypothetical protein [Methylobacterium sp. J-077]|uniref:hypothetical protein n=1 Tax=Methylobacterium sp. J-077 TaxID=2836656 RepID=UPI001FBABEF4|nr:hypothetical protein [Methylobacterium sp. J-077]MCJ2125116.1 hypothetical protein [Methylobacterium sp. J-077]